MHWNSTEDCFPKTLKRFLSHCKEALIIHAGNRVFMRLLLSVRRCRFERYKGKTDRPNAPRDDRRRTSPKGAYAAFFYLRKGAGKRGRGAATTTERTARAIRRGACGAHSRRCSPQRWRRAAIPGQAACPKSKRPAKTVQGSAAGNGAKPFLFFFAG